MKANVDLNEAEIEITIESGDRLDDYSIYDGPIIVKTFPLSNEDINKISAGMV